MELMQLEMFVTVVEEPHLPGQVISRAEDMELRMGGRLQRMRGAAQIIPATVPHFVSPQDQKPSHLVAIEQGSKSPIPVRRINTIANHRSQWEKQLPQLLTEGC